jgi:hypothetical protein
MQDSRKNNVVELSQFGHGRGALDPAGSAVLNACGETAALSLAAALATTLEKVANELVELTDHVTTYEMRRIYGAAMDFTRDQRGVVEIEFRRRFYQQFKRACRRDGSQKPGGADWDASELSLMEPDDLEETLAASTIENALNNYCGEQLFGLAKRMGVLLDDPDLDLGANPLGPEVIGEVIMETLKGQGLSVKTQLVLVPLINKFLPRGVKDVYQEINRHLIENGVLPTIRVGGRKPAPVAPPAQPVSKAPEAGVAAPEGGEDLLNVLRQLMTLSTMGYGGGVSVPAGIPTGMPGMLPGEAGVMRGAEFEAQAVSPAVLQNLTRLQRGQVEGFMAEGFDGARLADGQVNILREIRGSSVAGAMGQMDAMTLDIVAMVFDYILDDRRIPDAMKALIGRLQIPVLKVAMLDRAFFSQKAHPARRLLDVLAEASMGWNEGEGHESGLYKRVDDLVQRILSQFDEKMDIFAEMLEEFLRYQVEEKQRIDLIAGQSAQVIRRREQGEIARVVAHNEVESHLFDQSMPDFIRSFLLGQWEQLLGHYCAVSGEGGEDWLQALRTMDDLIWSVAPKPQAEDRRKLVALLPDLLKRLEKGLKVLGAPRELRDQFFTGLVKCHAVAVRPGLGGGSEALPTPDLAPIPAPEPAPYVAESGSMDFMEIPPVAEVTEVDPALLEEISAEPEERHLVEEIVIGDVGWLAGGGEIAEKDPYEVQVQQMKRGTWIEYQSEDGGSARAKLAWVSPLKGIYLFTNRLGQRAISINAEGLAAKFRDGQAQIIDNVPLMERAVNSLLERLQRKVA